MKKTYKILIALFLVFIFSVSILYVCLPKKEFSESEKRYLAEMPEASFSNISDGTFSSGFEEYLADHTPLRSFFVGVHAYFELLKGNNGADGVYMGKDGWLIEKPFDRSSKFEKNIRAISTFAKKQSIPVETVIVPSKGFVYSDKLPKNALDYLDSEALDSVKSDSFRFIDLRDTLLKNKDAYQLFYKTDHHWTSDGAFVAYEEICKSLGMTPAARDSFDRTSVSGFKGTSYSTSCYLLSKPDDVVLMKNKKTGGAAEVTISENGKDETFDNMFFEDALSESDKYVVFLDGNHAFERIKTGNEGGKLLLVKDSFAHCIAPFLAENYSEIIMIDLRYYKKPVSAVIADEGVTELMFLYGIDTFAESNDIILR